MANTCHVTTRKAVRMNVARRVPSHESRSPRRGLMAGFVAVALVLSGCATTGVLPAVTSAPTTAQTTAASAAPTPSATTSSAAPTRTVTLVANGDLLWHNTVWMSAQAEAKRTGKGIDGFNFDPMFAALKPIISGADVAICHEEVPFAPKGGPYKNYPVFSAPPETRAVRRRRGSSCRDRPSEQTAPLRGRSRRRLR